MCESSYIPILLYLSDWLEPFDTVAGVTSTLTGVAKQPDDHSPVSDLLFLYSLALMNCNDLQEVNALTMLGKLGKAEDIAGIVSYLAGPDGQWVTGKQWLHNE
jgi:hypothetical protein